VTASSLVSLRGVSVAYESGAPVLSGVDLDISRGEAILVAGPSGCGKSTLAGVCAGLIPGIVEARVTGEVVTDPCIRRPGAVGYVFQDPETQLVLLETGDEVAFGLENLRVPRADMDARIERALLDVDLAVNLADRHLTFSGGMKQKLAITCALAMDAQFIILDEPTANLDPHSARQVFDQIRGLKQTGKTLLVIEHRFDLLLSIVDRVVLLSSNGGVHRIADPQTVMREEWDWMLKAGVVPPWKRLPAEFRTTAAVPARAAATSLAAVPEAETGEVRATAVPASPAIAPPAFRIWAAPASSARFPQEPDRTDGVPPAFALSCGGVVLGGRWIWRDVSVAAQPGELIAVAGPNGAGKTTLLHALAGLQTLNEGTVSRAGWPDGRRRRDGWRDVGLCFQNPEYQFIYHTVGDELANTVLAGRPLPPEAGRWLAKFGLEGLESHSPFALSQGQKRRLSVAVMLREDRQVYLLDEPTFGQDAATQQAIMECLAELCRAGRTVVLTTHDMDLVRRYAMRVWVLADGALRFDGPPDELGARRDLLERAHLLDDVWEGAASGERRAVNRGASKQRSATGGRLAASPARALNPAFHLITVCLAVIVGIFAHTLVQALAFFILPLALIFAVARMPPWRVGKRLSPFLAVYVFYVWSLTAYGKATPGSPQIRILWMHPSLAGFENGLVLAFRMLSAVTFSTLFVFSADITDLIVSLCQNLRVSPRFAYGILAGIRFLPLFQDEWQKLRRARKLRGREVRFAVLRPVIYALPLLTQAIRMSERVAVAMEARGFRGEAAHAVSGRTFYRAVRVSKWDAWYGLGVVAACLAIVLWL
jgi:energy-coupling factor transporter ATP-binding protein EcfA2/energy-coupling factor transporter transmembrane protein EcfT